MNKPADSLSRAKHVDAVCDAFEAEWQAGNSPSLNDFLKRAPQNERVELFQELVPLEILYRQQRGDALTVEEFQRRYPTVPVVFWTTALEGSTKGKQRRPASEATIDIGGSDPTKNRAVPTTVSSPAGYELQNELGRGGMGVVYKAKQIHLGRTVALKMILSGGHASPEDIARFRIEAAAVAKVHHPNIVQVYDYGEHEGRPFFSLEFVDGGTLWEKTGNTPQPPRDAARQIETLARAMHHAHEAGVVHRDLKPTNVLLTKTGVAKITDFGLAKHLEGTDSAATIDGMIVGTPKYMSPEQASGGGRSAGPPADIYALGAILYEMLTGRPPFEAASLTALLRKICEDEPDPPRKVAPATPRDLETICLKCLQKDPQKRYLSAAALADDLQAFLADRPIAARPISSVERFWRWSLRNPVIAVLGSSIAMLLVVAAVVSSFAYAVQSQLNADLTKSGQELKQRGEALQAALNREQGLLVQEKKAKGDAETSAEQERQARLQADDARQAAEAAKTAAETSKNLEAVARKEADRTAALADARYFIHRRDLPEALVRLKKASDFGLRFEDRLVLNELYDVSRGQWELKDLVPVRANIGCFVSVGPEVSLVYATPQGIDVRAVGKKDVATFHRPSPVVTLQAAGAGHFIAADAHELLVYQVGEIAPIAHRRIDDELVRVTATGGAVVVISKDRKLRKLNSRTLASDKTWVWDELPVRLDLTTETRCYVSPSGRYIALQQLPWTRPAVYIDTVGSGKPAEIPGLRVSELAFDPKDETIVHTWFSPSRNGGRDDELNRYETTNNWKRSSIRVDGNDLKNQIGLLAARKDGPVLIGKVGLLETSQVVARPHESWRYDTLWPPADDAPEFLAATEDGSWLALTTKRGVAVFHRRPRTTRHSDENWNTQNWCTTVVSSGVISLNGRQMLFEPFDPTQASWTANPELPLNANKSNWYTSQIDVSADEKTTAILMQESETLDTISSKFLRKQILLYDVSPGIADPKSWQIRSTIDMPEVAGTHLFSTEGLRLSPQGETAALVCTDRIVRYECATGKFLSNVEINHVYAFSPSGALYACVPRESSGMIVVRRLADDVEVRRLPMGASGCCFSDDDKQLLVSNAGQITCYELMKGQVLWSRPSPFVPRYWPAQATQFVGLEGEDSQSGSAMVLADKETLAKTAILSRTAEYRSQVAFAPGLAAVYVDEHRWHYSLQLLPDLEGLTRLLATPVGAAENLADPLPAEK